MPVSYQEFAAVDKVLRMRSDANRFRATFAGDQIEVFRRFDSDVDDMLATFGIGPRSGSPPQSGSEPLLRMVLQDEQSRTYRVEQYRAGNWQLIADAVAARNLVQQVEFVIRTM